MIVAVAARSLLEIVFEVACAGGGQCNRVDRFLRQRRPAEIGVQHCAGQVEDRAQRRPELVIEPPRKPRAENAVDVR